MPEWFDRAQENIRHAFDPYRNEIYGHLIYQPTKRAHWKIPKGMRTLQEFLDWHEEHDIPEKRGDHPIAFEIYCIITTRRPLSRYQYEQIRQILQQELSGEPPLDLLIDWMEWGYDYNKTETITSLESKKRISRDGEHFTEIDITTFVKRRIKFEFIE